MTLFQALILAVVQGVTEPFPVSSLGHAVLLPALLRWPLDEHAPFFLPFLTMLHVGTLLALAGIFWKDWAAILTGLIGAKGPAHRKEALRVFLLLVVATIPAVLVGGALEHHLRAIFGAPLIVSLFLILNGVLLIVTERLRRRAPHQDDKPLSSLSVADAVIIGLWQCLALLPGLSRSGATINGGLLRGLNPVTAARFSLLMAQPIILAATMREAWQMRHVTLTHDMIVQSLAGAVAAGLTALLCSVLLLRFFRHYDDQALMPFGAYCIFAGAAVGFSLLS